MINHDVGPQQVFKNETCKNKIETILKKQNTSLFKEKLNIPFKKFDVKEQIKIDLNDKQLKLVKAKIINSVICDFSDLLNSGKDHIYIPLNCLSLN